jgi:hypothetical protein
MDSASLAPLIELAHALQVVKVSSHLTPHVVTSKITNKSPSQYLIGTRCNVLPSPDPRTHCLAHSAASIALVVRECAPYSQRS